MPQLTNNHPLDSVKEQLRKTFNDPDFTVVTSNVLNLVPFHADNECSDLKSRTHYLSYWRVYGESDKEYAARLNKAMSKGKITYSEMLQLTKPIVPQADPLNPKPSEEKKAPWE